MSTEELAQKWYDALNRLTKWRTVFTGWQLGTRAKGDAEGDAVRDHREVTILLRCEMTVVTKLLIDNGFFTQEEWQEEVPWLPCDRYRYTDGCEESARNDKALETIKRRAR